MDPLTFAEVAQTQPGRSGLPLIQSSRTLRPNFDFGGLATFYRRAGGHEGFGRNLTGGCHRSPS